MMKKSQSEEALAELAENQTLGTDGNLTFQNVGFALPGKQNKWLVKDVTGYVKAGQMLAIIGASGAGKTTMLDSLALRMSSPVAGKVCINGREISESVFHSSCVYVMQDNYLWPALTVRENMLYAAKLYVPDSSEGIEKKVDQLLSAVGLSSCADTQVGNVLIRGVSGGQKKRLSLAIELLKSPAILFLDEPTSGLDSAAAAAIMKLLTNIAVKYSKAIVCSIHQPESRIFLAFDQMMLLSQGRVAYFGPAKDACAYFAKCFDLHCPSNMNPADYLLEITNADFRKEEDVMRLLDEWPTSEEGVAMEKEVASLAAKEPPKPSKVGTLGIFGQLPILASRTFQNVSLLRSTRTTPRWGTPTRPAPQHHTSDN